MAITCDYCDEVTKEVDLVVCEDCFECGCFNCIDNRRCCNGRGFLYDSEFLEEEEEFYCPDYEDDEEEQKD